jgi:DNA replication protein DnaC
MAEDVCPKCGGSSWVVTERDGIAGAEQCECFLQTRARLIRERAGIPKLYHRATFETFRIPDDNPVTRNILSSAHLAAKSYADNLKKHPKPGLLFVGDPGTGKTHLAIATLKRILTNGFEGRFFDFQTLLEQIQRAGIRRLERQTGRPIRPRSISRFFYSTTWAPADPWIGSRT